MKYLDKALKFILEPRKAFNKEKKTSSDEAFKYLLVLSTVAGVIGAIISTLSLALILPFLALIGGPQAGILGAFSGGVIIVLFFIFTIVFVFGSVLWSIWLHIWVYILGAKKGIDQTFKSVFYGKTPFYFLYWIPFINIIALIWELGLTAIGLKTYHKITTGKAIASIAVAIIIPLLIMIPLILIVGETTRIDQAIQPTLSPLFGN